jgi:hypothetical protein
MWLVLAWALFVYAACQKPIPYTPEQRRDWGPSGPDYPDLRLGAPRDAGTG